MECCYFITNLLQKLKISLTRIWTGFGWRIGKRRNCQNIQLICEPLQRIRLQGQVKKKISSKFTFSMFRADFYTYVYFVYIQVYFTCFWMCRFSFSIPDFCLFYPTICLCIFSMLLVFYPVVLSRHAQLFCWHHIQIACIICRIVWQSFVVIAQYPLF